MNQLFRCKKCDEIVIKTPFDQYPEYEFGFPPSGEAAQIVEKDDFQDFLIRHHGHRLEKLKIVEDSFVSERPYSEPVKTSFFKATNGKEVFVIKKFRSKIDEPLTYRLVPGNFSLELLSIGFETEAIKKQLEIEFKESPISSEKVTIFLNLLRYIASNANIENLERVSEETLYPLERYYRMDDVNLMILLRNCHHIFKGQEYLNMEEFIQRHKEDGVLLLKAIYKIQMIKTRKRSKKVSEATLPLIKEKVVEKK